MAELPVIRVKNLQRHPGVEEWRWNEMLRTLGESIIARCIGVRRIPVLDPVNTKDGTLVVNMVPTFVLKYDEEVIRQVGQALRTEPEPEWVPEPTEWTPPDSEAWKQ